MKEFLKAIPVPVELKRRDRAGEVLTAVYEKRASMSDVGKNQLRHMLYFLEDPRIPALIYEGKLTVGAIKPRACEGKKLPKDDYEAAKKLLQEIGERALCSFSVKLTPAQAETFYAPHKGSFKKKTLQTGETLWHNVTRFASSDPITFVLIYDEKGKAIEWWRGKMGKTRPSEARPDTIRGKYATDEQLPNNLVHGSSSKEEALREFVAIKQVIEDLIDNPLQKDGK